MRNTISNKAAKVLVSGILAASMCPAAAWATVADDANSAGSATAQSVQVSPQATGCQKAAENLNTTKAAYDAAKADTKTAQQAYDTAKANYDAAVADKDAAQEQLASDTDALKDAKSKQQSAEQALTNAQSAQATAQANVDSAKSAYDDAIAQQKLGSYGFFQWLGDEKALSAFETGAYNSKAKDYVSVGATGDTTSLDNLKAASNWVREGNKVRAAEKTDPLTGKSLSTLLVDPYLVATAEIHTDWSARNYGHAQIFSVSENIAYGQSNPFNYDNGWMDEKEIYEGSSG